MNTKDLKNKLEQVKREREARSRSEIVRSTWDKLQSDENLSTKEKLEQLINLTRREPRSQLKHPSFEPQSREPIQFFQASYSLEKKYGRIEIASGTKISGNILSCLSRDPSFQEIDLTTALFVDLETTGLSGGTGVVPFLVGIGYYQEEKFYVSQYFLGDLAEEERMIDELGRFFKEMNFQSVVTFNGKSFDIPLLETRFILYRKPFLLSELPHLDFLFPARSLWRHKLESCRLFHLAKEVVEADRSEDIPSAEIPWRYFQYLQTGNFSLVEPILYHNKEDILSLLGLVVAGAMILDESEESCLIDGMDFFGAGKVLEKTGDLDKSIRFFEKALSGSLSDEVSLEARRRLSLYFKRSGEWEKAVSLWQEIISLKNMSRHHLFSFRELAMYFEHKLKLYEEALRIAEEGLVCSMGLSGYYEKDFRRRMERLKLKIRKGQG